MKKLIWLAVAVAVALFLWYVGVPLVFTMFGPRM